MGYGWQMPTLCEVETLLGNAELGKLLGVSRQRVSQLVTREDEPWLGERIVPVKAEERIDGDRADEVVNVDVTVEELRSRLFTFDDLTGLMDRDVQQLTWDAYMNKELVKAKPIAHARIFFKNIAHMTGLIPA